MHSFQLCSDIAETYNEIYSVYQAYDQRGRVYYAKIFSIENVQQYGLEEALQYNEEVLSDMQGFAFPQNFNNILQSIPNQGFFTFMTQPYETNLQDYMLKNHITEPQAMGIFDNILKAVYSVYLNGYWHKNIRPDHFVKIGKMWKLDSLVYSEDRSQAQDLQSEYIWNPAYQPPQVYERNVKGFTQQEFMPIVVWNLGSILLDLFFSVHKLKNYQILQGFKKKKFTLQDIKVKKTDIMSKRLKEILSSMLHYDPQSRMKLQDVFSNEFLSKEVAAHYKKRRKTSVFGSMNMRIFTGGKSALSSALKSQDQRQKGSKILPINEVIKQSIFSKQADILRKNSLECPKIQTDDQLLQNVRIFSTSIRKRSTSTKKSQKDSKSSKNSKDISSIEQLLSNKQLQKAIKLYKSLVDKSQLLSITANKFYEINYKEKNTEIVLISKFAVYFAALLNYKQLINNMQKRKNSIEIQNQLFNKFVESCEFQVLKKFVKARYQSKLFIFASIKDEIKDLAEKDKKLLNEKQIRGFFQSEVENTQFQTIKIPYRKILRISYETVTKQYNKNVQNQQMARLAMYIVYCLTVDKLYMKNSIEKNFSIYFEWANQQKSSYVPLHNFQQYIEEADVKILVQHASTILHTYFKV